MTTIIRAQGAPRFQLPGLEFAGLASPSRGSADLCTWRLTVQPAFASPDAHLLDRDEVFVVTRGAVRLEADGDVIAAGDASVVPAGTPIQLANAGEGEAELIVSIPAGFTATTQDGATIGTPPWAV